ncbi:LysR family transcriptional regulator [Microcoleus sp. FACHB-1515]|uniref:LysR family transcriptional regulator n=1 Tax=Cyanophyceae TaxID=3028117 RepID=UPI0016846D89|nr:LysR family transcriptional regulator [Microcoleus sp. FACHB-1515]MBD2089606.1 LysR family transcriptional regulator [Microcoleus sp. FACHB-1515]
MERFNLDQVKLSQVRAFVAVAECSNFGEAGLQLGVSQSAISHAIATLEDQLGVVLLTRGRHGAMLTPAGEQILPHARQMLQVLAAIGNEARLVRGLQGGQVRVSTFRSIATHILPEMIARFRQAYPQVSVSLDLVRGSDGVEQALRQGRADIGFICVPVANPDEFELWELMRDEYVALLPPDTQVDEPLTWNELARFPLIFPPEEDYCAILIRNHLAQVAPHLKPSYRINEDSAIVSMVMQGLGATIIARLAAAPLPTEARVYPLPDPLDRVIQVATLADALLSPAVYAFLNLVKQSDRVSALAALSHSL